MSTNPLIKQRSPWGVWALQLTIVYYFVWYVKVNRELARVHGLTRVGAFGMVLGQMVPIVWWAGLAHTSHRLSLAEARHGLPPSSSAGMTFLSSLWFGSQVRYLQRRVNALGLALDREAEPDVEPEPPVLGRWYDAGAVLAAEPEKEA